MPLSARVRCGRSRSDGPAELLVRLYPVITRSSATAAAIHLVFEPAHRRARVVPGEPGARGAAPHDLAFEKRMQVVHGVDLAPRSCRVHAKAERREPPLHLAEHVDRLLADRVGRGLARAARCDRDSCPCPRPPRRCPRRRKWAMAPSPRPCSRTRGTTARPADRSPGTHCCARPDWCGRRRRPISRSVPA